LIGIRRLLLLPLAASLSSCGSSGSSNTPSGSSTVNAVVFYDQNGNGTIDSDELVRFPGVQLNVGSLRGNAAPNGDVSVAGVPNGIQAVMVSEDSLPPYYVTDAPLSVQVPGETGSPIPVPITLPIGTNTPNVYMAFGDSITVGDGSTDGTGYRGPLQAQLQQYFGAATITDQGIEATRSLAGAERIASTFAQNTCPGANAGEPPVACTPAFVLIHYGTNDWNEAACRDAPPCYTITSLQTIVETVKNANSHPFLATIIPVNVGYDERVPPQRDVWVHNQDALIRQLAAQEGVVLVDLEAAFLKAFQDNGGNYQVFFTDHVHPSDLGYQVMAKTFFEAITMRSPSTAAALEAFSLRPPGVASTVALP
jgi:lysophospholipase L1-like esterase